MHTPNDPRTQLAIQAADAIEAFTNSKAPHINALVGFDGFVDSIIHIVDQRRSMARDDFERIKTIPEFAARCGAAAGRSANLEMVVQDVRFGGNGPLLSSALGSLGAEVTYIGAVGLAEAWTTLDPIYEPFAARCKQVLPICPPGRTDALEFTDGKIMLGKPENVQLVTWDHIVQTIGLDALLDMFDQSKLISVVNWTLAAGVEGIWEGLCNDIFPNIRNNEDRRLFIDLSDPAKRTDADIARAMKLIQNLQQHVPVSLGLNLAESGRIAQVIGVEVYNDQHNQSLTAMVPQAARRIREHLGLDCVVIHQHTGAGGANAQGESAWFAGPYTRRPRISTGAGDHFGGGFSFAQCIGMNLGQCLAAACGVAGAYVRDAQSPSRTRLIEFLRDLPAPE